jgi:hypothetical protein
MCPVLLGACCVQRVSGTGGDSAEACITNSSHVGTPELRLPSNRYYKPAPNLIFADEDYIGRASSDHLVMDWERDWTGHP